MSGDNTVTVLNADGEFQPEREPQTLMDIAITGAITVATEQATYQVDPAASFAAFQKFALAIDQIANHHDEDLASVRRMTDAEAAELGTTCDDTRRTR